MKKFIFILLIFCLYAIAYAPFLLKAYLPEQLALLTQNVKVELILARIMALTTGCFLCSLFALTMRWYRTSIAIAFVPLFVEAVFICSAFLLFVFHKEISHAFLVGKIRALGTQITDVVTFPLRFLHK